MIGASEILGTLFVVGQILHCDQSDWHIDPIPLGVRLIKLDVDPGGVGVALLELL